MRSRAQPLLQITPDNDFIDVIVHHTEGWLELKIETTDSFPIETQEELDVIYQRLSEALKTLK